LPRQNGPIGRIDRVLAMQIPVVEQAPSGAGGSDWNMMLAHDYTIVPPMTEPGRLQGHGDGDSRPHGRID
jgi:hypothetical protein